MWVTTLKSGMESDAPEAENEYSAEPVEEGATKIDPQPEWTVPEYEYGTTEPEHNYSTESEFGFSEAEMGGYYPTAEGVIGDSAEPYILLIIASICILFTLSGNMLIISTIWKTARLKHPMNMYLISLCCSDICIGCFITPMIIFNYVETNSGSFLCKLCEYFRMLSDVARIICSLTIAVQRYKGVVKNENDQSMNECRRNVTIGWIVAAIYASYIPFAMDYNGKKTIGGEVIYVCSLTQNQIDVFKGFLIANCFLLFLLPLITFSILYGRIIKVTMNVWRSEKQKFLQNVTHEKNTIAMQDSDNHEQDSDNHESSKRHSLAFADSSPDDRRASMFSIQSVRTFFRRSSSSRFSFTLDSKKPVLPKTIKQKRSLAFMLITLISLFFITKFPVFIGDIYLNFGPGYFVGAVRMRLYFLVLPSLNAWIDSGFIMGFNKDIRKAVMNIYLKTQKSTTP